MHEIGPKIVGLQLFQNRTPPVAVLHKAWTSMESMIILDPIDVQANLKSDT